MGPPGAAAVPCVPLQQVTDEELSSHLMFLIANEIAPNHQYLICMLQGHVLCKHCCESKHSAATGFSTASEHEEVDLLAMPLPQRLCLLRCTVQREDNSCHNLERMQYMPGKIIEMMRIILFSCSHSCTPHAQLQSPCPHEAH